MIETEVLDILQKAFRSPTDFPWEFYKREFARTIRAIMLSCQSSHNSLQKEIGDHIKELYPKSPGMRSAYVQFAVSRYEEMLSVCTDYAELLGTSWLGDTDDRGHTRTEPTIVEEAQEGVEEGSFSGSIRYSGGVEYFVPSPTQGRNQSDFAKRWSVLESYRRLV